MKPITGREILESCHGKWHGDEAGLEVAVQGIALDSRKIQAGWAFIATVGERVDGHSFIGQVYEKGAALVICEKAPEEEVAAGRAYILVEDSFKALKDIAAYYRSRLELTIVGITGSVGKTSTKEMIASVLSEKYKVQKTAGNFNNEVGLPLTLFTIEPEHEVAVVEMGISDFGEMSRLAAIARPDYMVITNIGQCHLENLKSRDGILKAKTECFPYMTGKGVAILNGEDDKLATVTEAGGKAPVFFSCTEELAEANCENAEARDAQPSAYASCIKNNGLLGSSFTLHIGEDALEVAVPLPGEHMVINALAAASVGHQLGMSLEEIKAGLAHVEAVDGRSHLIKTDQYLLIDDCYNANPVSMKAALGLLASANTRKVAILGDMFELGEEEKQMHAEIGCYAAVAEMDVVICIGRLMAVAADAAKSAADALATERIRAIQEAAAAASTETDIILPVGLDALPRTQVYHFFNKEMFWMCKDDILQPGDTILLKASHGMHFEELVKALSQEV